MSHWDAIRAQARAHHDTLIARAEGNPAAEALLAAAEAVSGIAREPVPPGDALLAGGAAVLDREAGTIWFDNGVEPWQALLTQAHEYGHFWLGDDHGACSATDVDAGLADDDLVSGAARVEGYGPRERREREANVFALELLLPTGLLRRWYLGEGLDAPAMAARTGLPEWLIAPQLSRAVLVSLPAGGPRPEEPEGAAMDPLALDPSQASAAFAPRGPLLLEAGPGTGKTRTLVGRLAHLLRQGVPPAAILALTFSNKAAEEMRQRVARAAPGAALGIWMGTFHAFGLDLLRKYGTRIGLPADPVVLDQIDALFLLEDALPDLDLAHYQNLYEPTMYLRDILGAISRAKDELIGPDEYRALADRMRESAGDDGEVEAAEKALEVAHVYAVYQARLEQDGLLDFGDLIFRPVTLLRSHADIRAPVQATYRHVLVDEYQDVNRDGGLFLREIAGDGAGLWAVGDVRQAIYRFRGAAPANMRLFRGDFPGARVCSLRRNYRSQPAVVQVVAGLAPRMLATAGEAFAPWETDRHAAGGSVRFELAVDEEAEGAGLAADLRRNREAGVPYRDQAVLCRSHTGLERIAAILERAGIPVLYLGNLLEREEIRDLLALLSLACEGNGSGLVRVARLPEYGIPLSDVRALLAAAREQQIPFPRALELAGEAPLLPASGHAEHLPVAGAADRADGATIAQTPDRAEHVHRPHPHDPAEQASPPGAADVPRHPPALSAQGRRGLSLLARHLDGIAYGSSPAGFLHAYLFTRGAYLRPLLADTSVVGDQKRMALYQFLQFAQAWQPRERDAHREPRQAFLRYVRRLRAFGEDRALRQLPDWAESLDAVRLLTVHASKGLEFSAVYLPRLGQGMFPARGQSRACPPPRGMLAAERDEDAEEEECLFFVALSRARDTLCLSRAQRYGKRNSNASPLLAHLAGLLPAPPTPTWTAASLAAPGAPPTSDAGSASKTASAPDTPPSLDSLSASYAAPALDPVPSSAIAPATDAPPAANTAAVLDVTSALDAPRFTAGSLTARQARTSVRPPAGAHPTLRAEVLEVYLDCPRRFYYEYLLGLGGHRDDTAYVQFHRCVYGVLRWLQEQRAAGQEVDLPAARERLTALWQAHGPVDHPYEAIYRRDAEKMVARAVNRRVQGFGRPVRQDMTVRLEHGSVSLRPDHVEVSDDGAGRSVLVQRLRTGRVSKSEADKDIYALYQQAGAEAFPEASVTVQTLYLATGETQDIRIHERSISTRLAHYDQAFLGITDGDYHARPDDRRCPRCPHYFVCPSGS